LAESSEQAKQSKQNKLGGIERYKQSKASKTNLAESSDTSKAASKFLASITFILLHLSFFCRGATVCGDSSSSVFVCIAEFRVSVFIILS
jgi:hypothetical protein